MLLMRQAIADMTNLKASDCLKNAVLYRGVARRHCRGVR